MHSAFSTEGSRIFPCAHVVSIQLRGQHLHPQPYGVVNALGCSPYSGNLAHIGSVYSVHSLSEGSHVHMCSGYGDNVLAKP